VKRRIESRWHIPPYAREVGLTAKLVLVFTITQEGNVSKLEITKTSGVSILDQAAVQAVRDAAPYASFPHGFTFHYLNVIASFEYVTSMIRSREPQSR
jgi:protein TonB